MYEKSGERYVCPYCYQRIENCTCDYPPHSLIMIDRKMQDIVRKLNEKGYTTTGCCESHYKSDCDNVYVSFAQRYSIHDNLPDGFRLRKNGNIIYKIIPCNDRESFEDQKEKAIEVFHNWVESL